MPLLADSQWPEITALRDRVSATGGSVQASAQAFVSLFADTFPSLALARLFIVMPMGALPEAEQAVARAMVKGDPRLSAKTPVLSLLGTRGAEPAWNDRTRSAGHRAIPLLDRAFVQGAPMIAKLLADLEVDLAGLDDGRPLDTRKMMGGRNCAFYVRDAATAVDALGRSIVPDRTLGGKHDVHTAFGMGGAYVDGTLVATVMMTTESLDRATVDRFPSLISNFKMVTAELALGRKIYAP